MKSYVYAIACLVLILLVGRLIAPQSYLWQRHSISQLAAQGYAQA